MLVSKAKNFSIKICSPKSKFLWNLCIGASSSSSVILKETIQFNLCLFRCFRIIQLNLDIKCFDSFNFWIFKISIFLSFTWLLAAIALLRSKSIDWFDEICLDLWSNEVFLTISLHLKSVVSSTFACVWTSFLDMTCEYFVFLHLNNSFSTLKWNI